MRQVQSQKTQWWKEGKLNEIVSEAEAIQKRLLEPNGKAAKKEEKLRSFARLMMEGQVKQTMKLVDADNITAGVHEMTDNVRE